MNKEHKKKFKEINKRAHTPAIIAELVEDSRGRIGVHDARRWQMVRLQRFRNALVGNNTTSRDLLKGNNGLGGMRIKNAAHVKVHGETRTASQECLEDRHVFSWR